MFRPAEIEIYSSMLNIPADAAPEDAPVLKKLLSLVKLISEKYSIECLLGRFNKQFPDVISIVLSNASIIKLKDHYEQETLKPILFLQSFGKCSTENKTPYPHLTSTVVTIDKDKIDDVMKGLHLIATPTQEEITERHQSRLTMAC